MQKNQNTRDWINLALGVWLFFSPWSFTNHLSTETATYASWNLWIVGAAVAISAGIALRDFKPWEEWVNLALGIWVLLSPWMLGYARQTNLMWNSIIIGAAIAIISGLSLPVARKLQQ